ncbi:protein EARLY FLOWERING 3 isoform X2 [Humulus lupulus]|nr:protein EARLY FLOWERING 3 isoform X2 [Humulus lupulus]
MPTHWSENFQPRDFEGKIRNASAAAAQHEQRKKVGDDDDDFMVPIFVQATAGQCVGGETFSSVSSTRTGQPVGRQNIHDKNPKQNNLTAATFSRDPGSERREDVRANFQSENHIVTSIREKIDGPSKKIKESSNMESIEHAVSNFSRSCDSGVGLQESRVGGAQLGSGGQRDHLNKSARDMEGGNDFQPRSESHCWVERSRSNEPENDSDHNSNSNRTCISSQLEVENVDKFDDGSETSMVDSISGTDISPDDVVGIIGQKHFWKARRAIANQQRVFAVQLFELHRLIKVQRLIAGSPNIMLEDGDILEKSSLKSYPAKKLSQEYVVVKPLPVIACCKDDSEKPNQKMEFSAENAVGKESFCSIETTSHFMNYGPYMGHLQTVATMTDNGMGPWGFHQPPGPQWLVPVMTPSEGLVYKPYMGPGMMGAGFGGHGPFGSGPVPGNFANSAYGIPASDHQGIGVFPGTYPVSHPYYPPYGMPMSNSIKSGLAVEEGSQFSGPGAHGEIGQIPGAEVHSNTEQQGSCNLPTKKSVSVPKARKFQASKGSVDFQGSTANSPRVGRTKENGSSHNAPPTAPVVPEVASSQPDHHHHDDTDQPIRVIKVVPHNARTATESAARIFRFIQQERKKTI